MAYADLIQKKGMEQYGSIAEQIETDANAESAPLYIKHIDDVVKAAVEKVSSDAKTAFETGNSIPNSCGYSTKSIDDEKLEKYLLVEAYRRKLSQEPYHYLLENSRVAGKTISTIKNEKDAELSKAILLRKIILEEKITEAELTIASDASAVIKNDANLVDSAHELRLYTKLYKAVNKKGDPYLVNAFFSLYSKKKPLNFLAHMFNRNTDAPGEGIGDKLAKQKKMTEQFPEEAWLLYDYLEDIITQYAKIGGDALKKEYEYAKQKFKSLDKISQWRYQYVKSYDLCVMATNSAAFREAQTTFESALKIVSETKTTHAKDAEFLETRKKELNTKITATNACFEAGNALEQYIVSASVDAAEGIIKFKLEDLNKSYLTISANLGEEHGYVLSIKKRLKDKVTEEENKTAKANEKNVKLIKDLKMRVDAKEISLDLKKTVRNEMEKVYKRKNDLDKFKGEIDAILKTSQT
jgi:hypothetical protein